MHIFKSFKFCFNLIKMKVKLILISLKHFKVLIQTTTFNQVFHSLINAFLMITLNKHKHLNGYNLMISKTNSKYCIK